MNNVEKSIGWAKWTINPVKGLCPVGCSYCYARRLYGRNCNDVFKNKTIRYDPSVFLDLYKAKPGDRVFVGSTIDLFHPLCSTWNDEIFSICRRTEELTFIFLTKQPQNLINWSPFPQNCYIGVSVTNQDMYNNAIKYLSQVEANVKFLSFEPLLSRINNDIMSRLVDVGIDWVIIGAQTPYSKKTAPQISWVQEILVACHNTNIPVFMKNNLQPVIDHDSLWAGWKLRHEFPNKE